MTRRICVVTSSRADYGLLYHPMRAIQAAGLDLQLVVTGMHLSPEFGMTVREIERDGFPIAARVEMLVSSDSAVGVGKSVGLGVAGFADLFGRDRPDLVLLLGDRFEMLAAASAALVANLPIGHLCGGDVTKGAYDDSIRHSLTKMAHLHFVTNEDARRRVIQLGEDPDAVILAGSSGLDFIRDFEATPRDALAADLGVPAERPWLLVTFHPATRDPAAPTAQLAQLLSALETFLEAGYGVVATQSNADNEGRALSEQLQKWAAERDHAAVFPSLGQQRYLSCMQHCAAVVGNSSSGLYEAPSFERPTVNIGLRQEGRPKAPSVIDCAPEADAIRAAITQALSLDCSGVVNPYGDGHASQRIVQAILDRPDMSRLVIKEFHDLEIG